MGLFATGARRSHPAKIAAATPGHEHPAIKARLAAHNAGTAPLPASVDLGQYWPSILDQNQTGSCTAHAIACAITTTLGAAGKPLGFVPSPLCTYAATRALERAVAQPLGAIPNLTDSGAEIADVIAAIAKYGVRPMKAPSPQGFNSDVDASNVLAEPDLQGLELAGQTVLAGPYYVDPASAGASDVLAASLAAGIAIDVAFLADDALQNIGPGQVVPAPINGPDAGGHSVALTGYITNADGTRSWWLTNSWNAKLGDRGARTMLAWVGVRRLGIVAHSGHLGRSGSVNRFAPLLLLAVACTPVPPVVPTPDASDASALGEAAPATDSGFTGPCAPACLELQVLGCVVLPDCATVLQQDTTNRLIRNAKTGQPLTCADVAAARSVADVKAMGQPCGP